MVDHLCSICQRPVRNTMTCAACCRDFDLNASWAVKALAIEKERRNLSRREERFGVRDVDSSGEVSFEDILDSSDSVENLLTQTEQARIDQTQWQQFYNDFHYWALDYRGLSECEFSAIMLAGNNLSSDEAATVLSEREGKTVTPAAYRRRVATARKKMRRMFTFLV